MPSLSDTRVGLEQALDELLTRWNYVPQSTRILVVLTLIVGLIYVGSRVERAGLSAVIFLSAFALFAYLFALGYALMG